MKYVPAVNYAPAVCTVPSRQAQAEKLSEFLDGWSVSCDDFGDGSNKNHDRTWRMARTWAHVDVPVSKPSPWCVVFEDDAVPFTDDPGQFAQTLSAVLDNAPTPIVSLYTGRGRPGPLQPRLQAALQRADNEGAAWITDKNLYWGVAVAMPTDFVPGMLEWVERCDNPYDERLGMWARGHGHRISYTVPSLVDHADEPSVIHDDREPGRVAHRVLSRDEVVDWSTHSVWL